MSDGKRGLHVGFAVQRCPLLKSTKAERQWNTGRSNGTPLFGLSGSSEGTFSLLQSGRQMSIARSNSSTKSTRKSRGRPIRQALRNTRIAIARGLLRCAFSMAAIKLYEPVEIGGRRFRSSRETDARWSTISEVLKTYSARNLLDIGCAEGWLVRRAAVDLGCFAIGVEASNRALTGEVARLHDAVERASIMQARLSAEDIRSLPLFDAVLCLSVVHHVVRRHGLKSAQEFIEALVSRARKVVIFEMGTSEEERLNWSNDLPDMPEGQEAFVTALLRQCGLKNVRRIGASDAFHGSAQRLLFVGEPGS